METLASCLQWFKHSFIGQVIYEVYNTFKVTWFVVFFLLLGYYALTQVGQAQDIFSQLNQFTFGSPRSTQLLIATLVLVGFTLVWSQCSWYSARVGLRVACIEAVNPAINRLLQEWTPRFFALMPPLVLAKAFSINGQYKVGFWLSLLLLAVLLVYFYIRFIRFRNPQAKKKYYQQGMPIRKALRTNRYISWFMMVALTAACLLVFVLPFFISINPLLRLVGPAAIIVFGLSFWTLVILFLAFIDYKTNLPVSLIFLGFAVIFTYSNNNHRIRTLPGDLPARQPAEAYFKGWIKSRLPQVSSSAASKATYPVFIVAAEGGGIRAAYWTASVMARLQQDNPAFASHVFAISGVSGGSLGGVIFNALYADNLKLQAQNKPPVDMLNASRAILSTDFLSPLNTALMFPDMLQKVQPFGLGFTDRARWLEDDWAHTYSKVFKDSTWGEKSRALHEPFLDLWLESVPYQVPALLLNCTRVETGEKAIVSNLEVKDNRFGAIDLLDVINARVPLKTATLLSARFPFVTPSGTVYARQGKEKKEWGNIVDGGYVDNTGLETAMSLANMIYELKFTAAGQVPENIEVFVLFIKNSDSPVSREYKPQEAEPMQGLYETRGPINAFYNAWDNGIHSRVQNAENFFKVLGYTNRNAGNATVKGKAITFELTRDSLNYKNLPLGWFLSDSACAMLDNKLRKQMMSEPFREVQALLKLLVEDVDKITKD